MKRFSNVLVVLFLVITFLSSTARALSPSDLSAKITETMREIQARHSYYQKAICPDCNPSDKNCDTCNPYLC